MTKQQSFAVYAGGILAAVSLGATAANAQTANPTNPSESGVLSAANGDQFLATITNPGPNQNVAITSIGNDTLQPGETLTGNVKGTDGRVSQSVLGTVAADGCGCLNIDTKNETTGHSWHSPAPITVSPVNTLTNTQQQSQQQIATSRSTSTSKSSSSAVATGGNGYGGAGGAGGTGGVAENNLSIVNKQPGAVNLGGGGSNGGGVFLGSGVSCQFLHQGKGFQLGVGTLTTTLGGGINGGTDSHTDENCVKLVNQGAANVAALQAKGQVDAAVAAAQGEIVSNMRTCNMQALAAEKVLDLDADEVKTAAAADCKPQIVTQNVYVKVPAAASARRVRRPTHTPKPCGCDGVAAAGPKH